MGMLTFSPSSRGLAAPELVVPNRVMRELQWEHLALSVKDSEHVWMDTLDLQGALQAMAAEGDIEPLLALFREQVVARLGNKDLRQLNEKVLKLMLLAHISQSRTFRDQGLCEEAPREEAPREEGRKKRDRPPRRGEALSMTGSSRAA